MHQPETHPVISLIVQCNFRGVWINDFCSVQIQLVKTTHFTGEEEKTVCAAITIMKIETINSFIISVV